MNLWGDIRSTSVGVGVRGGSAAILREGGCKGRGEVTHKVKSPAPEGATVTIWWPARRRKAGSLGTTTKGSKGGKGAPNAIKLVGGGV